MANGFDPAATRIGIVTCGGLCPGLNSVIRSLFLQAKYIYGVEDVLGFRNGYQGLDPRVGQEPLPLTHDRVEDIHWFVGDSAPVFYYNLMGGDDDSPFFAQAMVKISDRDWSSAQTIVIDPETGTHYGGTDPRTDGAALGYSK